MARAALGQRPHGQQHAPDVGMLDDRARAVRRAGRAALPALARIGERLLGRALGDGDALQRRPTRRASFIIVNMQARPRFSSPTS